MTMSLAMNMVVGVVLISSLAVGALILTTATNYILSINEEPNITSEEAKAIAEEHTGGTAISVTFEKEDDFLEGEFGEMVYEVIVETENGRYEVEINAKTGEVLEVESVDGD